MAQAGSIIGDRIRTRLGELEGVDLGGAHAFLGVPYARPPVGKMRFRPPEPAEPWAGVRSAFRFGPAAPQPSLMRYDGGCSVGESDEDCLYLNVWASITPGPHPVIFWIHGGGYVAGSSAEAMYDGANLARQGSVVVSFNYRVGTLGGFVYMNELGDPRLAESANLGIADTVMALRWVHEHIESFGGDPDCVTIIGESVGGMTVQTLMGLDAAAGMFHRAIAMSPGPLSARKPEVASIMTDLALEELWKNGIPVNRIYDAAWQPLQAACIKVMARVLFGPLMLGAVPTLDGRVITAQPVERVREGLNRGVPLIVGNQRDELAGWDTRIDDQFARGGASDVDDELGGMSLLRTRPDDELAEAWSKLFPDPQRAQRMAKAYSAATCRALVPTPPSPMVFLQNDHQMRIHGIRLLEAHSHPDARTYSYLFEWGEPGKGCPHESGIPFLFGTADSSEKNRLLVGKGPDVNRLTATVQGSWMSFARTGNPNHEPLPEWPIYDLHRRATMSLSLQPKIYDDPWGEQRSAWDGYDVMR